MQTRANRQSSERYGRLAELLAALMLVLKGYRLLAHRFRTRCGEIDLIAVRGKRLAFVEVKARRRAEETEIAIVAQDAGRLADAAEIFVARRPRYRDHVIALDAVLISRDRWPRHIMHALQPA